VTLHHSWFYPGFDASNHLSPTSLESELNYICHGRLQSHRLVDTPLASEWLQTAEMIGCTVVTCRDEAARIWQQRESEWERERLARQQLMQEVSCCLEL